MDYLKNIPLDPPNGALIAPFAFCDTARMALGKWLLQGDIDSLQGRIEVALHFEECQRDEPKMADQRDFVQHVHGLSEALAMALENAPTEVSGLLDLVAHNHLGGWQERDLMVVRLKALSKGVSDQLEKFSEQTRRVAKHQFLISQIVDVVSVRDIRVSCATGSKFFKLCKIVFDAADTLVDSLGVTRTCSVDPRGAIRAYMATQDKEKNGA